MKKLICNTTAYKVFCGDNDGGKLSHAYMLHFADARNLRAVLKIFALRFFGLDETATDGKRLLNEALPDCRIFPEEGKKLNAEAVAAILDDSAMRPLERDKKLFIICGFEQASPLLQNKLLKTLEEPPQGVYFLLGATSLSPVLDTVRSRVKTLTIPPFSEGEIFAALERKAKNPLNADAAKSCGGILGAAENMVGGGWYEEVRAAAKEICTTVKVGKIGEVASKYGDTQYKAELLAEIQLNFYNALCEISRGNILGEIARLWQKAALIYAVENVNKACADVKFNAYFQGLLYDMMLRNIEENDRWLKLQA
ncbi:MAG: hypothetical protein K2N33_03380 [Clostridia bacterium]|nr:hypothetical protein [Clostridia bacterium]